MIGAIFRNLWRLLLLVTGAVIAWFFVFEIYPYADTRFPAYIVALVLYCAFVYGIMPALFRLLRVFITPDHIPLYATTGDGWPSDPVNLALVVKNSDHLRASMKKAGWYEADPLTFHTGAREVLSIILNRAYPSAPLSNLYLFNRSHDIGFEIPTNSALSARTRHHVRFWRLEEPRVRGNKNEDTHYSFWQEKLKKMFTPEREIWIGAATEETYPIDIQWRTGQLTHGGSHNSDQERDFIIQSLCDAKLVKKISYSTPGDVLRFRGQQIHTHYTTDGSIKVARIK
jgi:hypothetical protein